MKKKYLITLYRRFKHNYYIVKTVNASKTIEEGYKECKAFALHKHLLKGKCIWFKVTLKK